MDFCRRCGAVIHDGDRFCPSCGARVSDAPSGGRTVKTTQDAQNNKVMAILCYLGPLVFVPIFTAKNSPFVRFHANQGFTLFFAWLASAVLDGFFWIFGWLLSIAVLVFSIIGIVNAAQGLERELPLIGGIRLVDQWFKNI